MIGPAWSPDPVARPPSESQHRTYAADFSYCAAWRRSYASKDLRPSSGSFVGDCGRMRRGGLMVNLKQHGPLFRIN
jgi:hypothetical protein